MKTTNIAAPLIGGVLAALSLAGTAAAERSLATIPDTFTEPFYCGGAYPNREDCGIRFRIRDVEIEGGDNVHETGRGGYVEVSMQVLHDCRACGNAINQVIVGLSSDDRAQVSVWNGKQRSGGALCEINPWTDVAVLGEDNAGPAEWTRVTYSVAVPDRPGTYYLRARYAQAYQGNLLTAEGRKRPQPRYEEVLDWWQVDRPGGPGPDANIGAIIVH